MFVFEFVGNDSSSDAGYWTVVIIAKNLKAARQALVHHMRAHGREFLTKDELIPVNKTPYSEGVVFSNVESR